MNLFFKYKRSKKLFIPFPNESEDRVAGPLTFLRNLKSFLDDKDFDYTNIVEKGGGIFFPISYDANVLDEYKLKGRPIIQRLDGIYYPQKAGPSYKEKNAHIEKIYKNYADFIIFQSQYSKAQCFEMFGEFPDDRYAMIVNGADSNRFYPGKIARKPGSPWRFSTNGNFRDPAMIAPVIESLDLLRDEIDFNLSIAGPIADPALEKYLDRDYVIYEGELDSASISQKLRETDIFIYSHLNTPCPNSVIESITSGVPVVGFDSGAMSELLSFSPELLAYVSDDVFQKYEDFDSVRLSAKIQLATTEFEIYKARAVENIGMYTLKKMGEQYVDLFEKILNVK